MSTSYQRHARRCRRATASDGAGVAVTSRRSVALMLRKLVANAGFEASGGLLAVNQLIESRQQFTAIFGANDESAYGAQLGLYRQGIRVPEDVSLVVYDDLPGSAHRTPPLTSVRQPLT